MAGRITAASRAAVWLLGALSITGCGQAGLDPGQAGEVDRDPDNPAYGRLLYAERCAACHGPEGRGDGALVDTLPVPPANLRGLAARNGGVFDRDQVMSAVFGPSSSQGSPMPAFGHGDLGPWIIVERDGLGTPVPTDLLAVATYLETIQEL